METHVRRLAIADFVVGIVHLLAGVALILFVGGTPFSFGDVEGETFKGVMISLLALILLTTGLVALVGGRMIQTRTANGRVVGLFAAFFLVVMIPFGMIVGGYGIWVLFQDDIERLFPAHS